MITRAAFFHVPAKTGVTTSKPSIRSYLDLAKALGGMPTLTGAEQFGHLRSYPATDGKHGINLLDALIQLASGRPWIPTVS